MEYAELHCRSNFTFLDGASHPEDMIERALELGYTAIALTDRDGLYAAVRVHVTAQEKGIHAIHGAEVTLEDGSTLTLLARDAEGYQNLSSLLTAGRRARPKGQSAVAWSALEQHARGLIVLTGTLHGRVPQALLRGDEEAALLEADRLLSLYGPGQVYLEVTDHELPIEARLRTGLVALARTLDLPLVATQDARYARPGGQRLHDVLTCIRHHTSVQQAGTKLMPNGEYFLQPREVLARRFRALPEALRNTLVIAEQCSFALPQLDFDMPVFPIPAPYPGALEYLEHLTFLNAPIRFPEVGARVVRQLRHELEVIGRHRLEGYFLIVWDIMKFCHDQGILAQGRGSAANSAVCFALGITNVDPIKLELLFERFLSEGRKEAPDIDLDIANDRREEVIQYVYERYGRDHAGMVCEVISFRARSAVRDVGKALGLSLDQVDRIARGLDGRHFSSGVTPTDGITLSGSGDEADEEAGEIDPSAMLLGTLGGMEAAGEEELPHSGHSRTFSDNDSDSKELSTTEMPPDPIPDTPLTEQETRIADLLWELCTQIEGFPRHLGIHVGGMIICAAPLGALVPIENATMAGRTVIQWDKDDIGALKMPKIDLLGLGMLSMIGEAMDLIQVHTGKAIDPARLTYDDPKVYDLFCDADTVGVFQVESRAQMNVLPHLKPRRFYDLVVQVSLIRPGPIQGQMVNPYLRRRDGTEEVVYPHPDLKPVLERTLGVPLFQEQGMKVAVVAAGFTPSEADDLRRAMSSKRAQSKMEALTLRLIDGMLKNGYDQEIVHRIVNQIKAFASYGFPESHAASFALLVYLSGWLKVHHPLPFYAALLNNQPMGFYAPSTIVNEIRRRNIEVLAIDVVRSSWEWTIEAGKLRVGLRSVKGMGETHQLEWETARKAGPWRSVEDVCERTGWSRLLMERLAMVAAFRSLGVDRREALWRVQGYRPRPGLASAAAAEPQVLLKPVGAAEALVMDMRTVRHSVEAHPIQLMRPTLNRWKVVRANGLERVRGGDSVRVAGVVSVRQKPPTAKGFCFLTLEDETGMINAIVRPDKYEEFRPIVRRAMIVLIEGVLKRQRGVISIMVEKIAALDERWAEGMRSRDFH